jgi:predicted O-methyltransferase YrrM
MCKYIIAILSLMISTVSSVWNPEELEIANLQPLNDVEYQNLKNKVCNGLDGYWCSVDKAEMLMDLVYLSKPRICVEIGVFAGGSAIPIAVALKHAKAGTLYAIDPWSVRESLKNLASNDPNREWFRNLNMIVARNQFRKKINMMRVQRNCRVLSESSEKAVSKIPAIDFLHIDGNYSEYNSLHDVEKYLPKVKVGGYILLSNIFIIVNGNQPKLKALSKLHRSCEFVCELEEGHVALFRKEK